MSATKFEPEEIQTPSPNLVARIIDDPEFPRGDYATDVMRGQREISGADLKGRAKRYGGSYARKREQVRRVAARYGVIPLPTMPHGRLVWHYIEEAP